MERILLAHLSDIHMGSVRNRFFHPNALRAGLHGHDPKLCQPLQNALEEIRAQEMMDDPERLFVVVSGDLACTGLGVDFAVAHTFLLARLVGERTGAGLTTGGLELPADSLWTVPGNHDHWDGHRRWPQPAHDPALFPDTFARTPWRDTLVSYHPATGAHDPARSLLHLDLFGVDSNSGLAGRPYNDTAYGELSHAELFHSAGGLDALLQQGRADRQRLERSRKHQVRAIVCHHSFNNKLKKPAPWYVRLWRQVKEWHVGQNPDPLLAGSVQQLVDLAAEYDVKAVLTGHTHYFWEEANFSARYPQKTVWELRSSTALQGPALDAVQGFLLHRIRLDGKPPAPVWEYQKWQFRTNRFHPSPWYPAS